MFLVDGAHQCRGWRQHLIHEDEDGFLGRELDALADDIDELADGEVGRDQVFLLIDGGDVGFLDFFTNHLLSEDAVSNELNKEDSEASCPDGDGDEMKRNSAKIQTVHGES